MRPVSPRGQCKKCCWFNSGEAKDSSVKNLPDYLRSGDLLVFNNTKVIPGRLYGKRGEAKVEVTLHKREAATQWRVFAKPAKKCRLNDMLNFAGLEAQVIGNWRGGGTITRL